MCHLMLKDVNEADFYQNNLRIVYIMAKQTGKADGMIPCYYGLARPEREKIPFASDY